MQGGVHFNATVPLTHMDEKMVMRVLQEYKVHNADILFREDATVDDFIDVMEVCITGGLVWSFLDYHVFIVRLCCAPNISLQDFFEIAITRLRFSSIQGFSTFSPLNTPLLPSTMCMICSMWLKGESKVHQMPICLQQD